MVYVVHFKIYIKQTSDLAQGNEPNSYTRRQKRKLRIRPMLK